jgi:hypothetical protein
VEGLALHCDSAVPGSMANSSIPAAPQPSINHVQVNTNQIQVQLDFIDRLNGKQDASRSVARQINLQLSKTKPEMLYFET